MRRGSYGSGSLGVGMGGSMNPPAALSATGVGGCMLPGSAMPLSAYPGSMGIGGYSKPPPAPPAGGFSHPPPARAKSSHIQTDFSCDRMISKDKYGPSLGGLACSLPASREKSPNSGAGASMPDIHDCSMCLAAYIQSLNTVCGSASRLSQCLASLGSQSSSQHALKEACEGWEGLTRAVGVASAAVKAHMLALLQEATKPSSASGMDEEMGDTTNKMHMEKLVSSLCSSYLSLQCQFAGAVLETFAPYSSMVLPLTPPSSIEHSPSLSSQFSTPATPPHFSAQLTPPPSANSNFTLGGGGTGASSHQNTAVSKMRSRTNSVNYLNPHHPGNQFTTDNGQNLQPPGFNTATHGGGGGGGDSSFRRWSMGASGYSASNTNGNGGSGVGNSATGGSGPCDKLDSDHISGPGPPRRWSVPETTNDPPPSFGCSSGGSGNNTWSGGGLPWGAGACNNPALLTQGGGASNTTLSSANDGAGAMWQPGSCGLAPDLSNGGDTSRRLSVPVAAMASSRESSAGGTRSNSHSRSATPDPGKSSSSLISLDELDELVDLVNNNHLKNFTGAEGSCSSTARSRGDKDGCRAAAASSLSRTSSRSSKSSDLSGSGSAKQDAEGSAGTGSRGEETVSYTSSDAHAHTQPTNETHGDGSSKAGGECVAISNNCNSGSTYSTSTTATKSGGQPCKQHMHLHSHHRHCIARRDVKLGSKGDGNSSLPAVLDPDVANGNKYKSHPVQTTAPSSIPNASTPAASTKKTMPACLVQGSSSASLSKVPVRHGPLPHSSQQHQRYRSPFHHQFPANNQQQQYQHLQQVQLQQYLYQQQLQANAYFKLSPISSSILKQQQYFPQLQQHIYQKQQQQLQLQQLQQLKLNQSLQFLHLQQQQQQQQQRLHHQQQQQRKSSLQNLSTYYQELSNLGASLFNESAASVAAAALEDSGGGGMSSSTSGGGGSRRGSGNTSGGAGTATRTPVIHEATMENMDSLDAVGGPFSDRWDRGVPICPSARTGPQCRGQDALSSAGAVDALLGRLQHKPSIPEVVTTSTPLWPPSGSVPGVTLTECTEEFKQPHALGSGWPLPDIGQDYGGGSESRDAPSRASWPSGHSLRARGVVLGGSALSEGAPYPNPPLERQLAAASFRRARNLYKACWFSLPHSATGFQGSNISSRPLPSSVRRARGVEGGGDASSEGAPFPNPPWRRSLPRLASGGLGIYVRGTGSPFPQSATGSRRSNIFSRPLPSSVRWGSGGLSLGGLIQDSASLLGGSAALGDNRSTSPSSKALQQQQQLPFMRRHSDTSSFGPYQASYQQQQQSLLWQQQQQTAFSQQQQHPLDGAEGGLLSPQRHHYQTSHPLPPLSPGRNSRSSDNLHMVPDSSDVGLSICSDATLESLLTLNALLPNSSPPSPTARYTLFSSHT